MPEEGWSPDAAMQYHLTRKVVKTAVRKQLWVETWSAISFKLRDYGAKISFSVVYSTVDGYLHVNISLIKLSDQVSITGLSTSKAKDDAFPMTEWEQALIENCYQFFGQEYYQELKELVEDNDAVT